MKRLGFSARARGRILKLARTIADLDGEATITALHVSQAVMLRYLDRNPTRDTLSGEVGAEHEVASLEELKPAGNANESHVRPDA
jgi:hypothetical protein